MRYRMFKPRLSTGALLVAGAGLVLLGAPAGDAPAQDRVDQLNQSAAERQASESFGQPSDRDYTERQQSRQTDDQYDELSNGQRYSQDRPLPPGRDDQSWNQYQQDSLRDGRDDQQGGLGVVLGETDGRGARVVNVYLDSPAAQAGLRRGDQIVAINGQRIGSVRELQSRISQREPGSRIEIVALRNGRERVFNARLESRQEALSGQRAAQNTQRWSQDSRYGIEARLVAVERQLQQLLSDVRMLRSQVSSNAPERPRQAMSDRAAASQQGFNDSRLDGRETPAEDQYFEDQENREGQQGGDDF